MGERTCWTVEAVRALGLTTDIETAGQILGIGRTKAYEMARAGDFPVRILRVGRRYRVATPLLLELLGWVARDEARSGDSTGADTAWNDPRLGRQRVSVDVAAHLRH